MGRIGQLKEGPGQWGGKGSIEDRDGAHKH